MTTSPPKKIKQHTHGNIPYLFDFGPIRSFITSVSYTLFLWVFFSAQKSKLSWQGWRGDEAEKRCHDLFQHFSATLKPPSYRRRRFPPPLFHNLMMLQSSKPTYFFKLNRGARQLTGDEERGGVKSKQIRIAPKFTETNQIKWSFRSNKKVRKLLINLIMQYWVLLAA